MKPVKRLLSFQMLFNWSCIKHAFVWFSFMGVCEGWKHQTKDPNGSPW